MARHIQTGAFVADENAVLSNAQRNALRRILVGVYEIAQSEADLQREHGEHYEERLNTRRPRHVFVVDGPRGSGKTTMLLTLQTLVAELARPHGQGAGRALVKRLMTPRPDDAIPGHDPEKLFKAIGDKD